MQQAEKLDLDEEIKLLEKTVMRKELSTSTDRIKRTPKPTAKATFLTIVSDFTLMRGVLPVDHKDKFLYF